MWFGDSGLALPNGHKHSKFTRDHPLTIYVQFWFIKILIKINNCQKKLLIFNSLLSNVVVRIFKVVLLCFKISIKLSVNVKETRCLQTRTDEVVTPDKPIECYDYNGFYPITNSNRWLVL